MCCQSRTHTGRGHSLQSTLLLFNIWVGCIRACMIYYFKFSCRRIIPTCFILRLGFVNNKTHQRNSKILGAIKYKISKPCAGWLAGWHWPRQRVKETLKQIIAVLPSESQSESSNYKRWGISIPLLAKHTLQSHQSTLILGQGLSSHLNPKEKKYWIQIQTMPTWNMKWYHHGC